MPRGPQKERLAWRYQGPKRLGRTSKKCLLVGFDVMKSQENNNPWRFFLATTLRMPKSLDVAKPSNSCRHVQGKLFENVLKPLQSVD